MFEKKIKTEAAVIEKRILIQDGRKIAKIGLQPQACQDHAGNWIQLGGQYIETEDLDFFDQEKLYEIEITITRPSE